MSGEPIIRTEKLKKWFPLRRGFFASLLREKGLYVKAVDGISFQIYPGEIFGLAGESGCGKTTTGRTILRLIEPTGGKIYYKDQDITKLSSKELKPLRKEMQIIFQDPYESLNPRMSIYDIISEPLRVQKITANPKEEEEQVFKALEEVELIPPEEFVFRFPHELSGGQRQRVAIARAFILKPKFIVADEPVSMLDVSIRSEILKIMLREKERYKASILFITHDLSLARHMCTRLAIMYLGKIVEMGETESLIQNPLHPYTRALIAAVPVPDPDFEREKIPIKGEVPSPVNLPPGCRFHPRCPYAMELCEREEPKLKEVKGKLVACHLFK